jgi:hypothetical protein
MAVPAKAIRNLGSGADAAARQGDNIRGLLRGTGPRQATGRVAAGSPNFGKPGAKASRSDDISFIRQLALSPDPADRAMLQEVISSLSERGQKNLQIKMMEHFRDPRSSIDAPVMTPEGQMLHDIAFNGAEPSPEQLDAIRQTGDVGGMDDAPIGDDIPEKTVPYKQQAELPEGVEKLKQPGSNAPLTVNQEVAVGPDGQMEIKNTSSSLDRSTAGMIAKSKKKQPLNFTTDPNKADRVARRGETPPIENYSQALRQILEMVDPRGVKESDGAGMSRRLQQSQIATSSAQDYDTLQYLLNSRGITNPNQFSDPRELAKALISGAPQDMFDVTPITRRDRMSVEDALAEQYPDAYLADDMPDELRLTQTDAEIAAANLAPEITSRASMRGRQTVQDQAIETLARKLEDTYGSSGWGDQYVAPAGVSDLPAAPHVEMASPAGPRKTTEGRPSAWGPAYGPENKPPPPAPPKPEPSPLGDPEVRTGKATSDASRLDRTGKRQEIIDTLQPYYPDRNFTTRSAQEVNAELAQMLPDDPGRNALEMELRDARLIDSYMEKSSKDGPRPDRLPKRKRKAKPKQDNPAEVKDEALENSAADLGDEAPGKQPMDNDGKPLDSAEEPPKPKDADGNPKDQDGKPKDVEGKTKPEEGKKGGLLSKKKLAAAALIATPFVLNSMNHKDAPGLSEGPSSGGGMSPEELAALEARNAKFRESVGGGVIPVSSSAEDRIRSIQNAMNMKLNSNTQRLGNWRK